MPKIQDASNCVKKTRDVAAPLPCDLGAERSILGAIILDNCALSVAVTNLRTEDFFLLDNRRIFGAMLRLAANNKPVDSVVLLNELERSGEFQQDSPAYRETVAYISTLTDGLPRVTNVKHYAGIVREKATLRSLIHSMNAIQEQALAGGDAPHVILGRAESAFAEIRSLTVEPNAADKLRRVTSLGDILRIADLPDTKEEYIVDRFLMRGCTTMLCARPDQYKSWLSLLMCRAITTGTKFLGQVCRQVGAHYLFGL